MAAQTTAMVVVPVAALVLLVYPVGGLQYTVGDSVWSIPPTTNFYNKWSSNQSFRPGDTLFFDFESEMYNVMQVSVVEYETCTSNHPLKAYNDGPAVVSLTEEGQSYFMCNIFNYCALGQKLTVSVNRSSPSPIQAPLPSPPTASGTTATPAW